MNYFMIRGKNYLVPFRLLGRSRAPGNGKNKRLALEFIGVLQQKIPLTSLV